MAFTSFSPNTQIKSAELNANFAAIADGSEVTGAWVDFSPTIAPGSGSYTTVSTVARYIKIGKTVIAYYSVTTTNVGTGTGALTATLPVSAANTTDFPTGSGRARASSGKQLQAIVVNNSSQNQVHVYNYDNSTPTSNGEILVWVIVYQAA